MSRLTEFRRPQRAIGRLWSNLRSIISRSPDSKGANRSAFASPSDGEAHRIRVAAAVTRLRSEINAKRGIIADTTIATAILAVAIDATRGPRANANFDLDDARPEKAPP